MGQQEVTTFLEKNRNKWFTSRQITKKLKVSAGSVMSSMKKLRQSNLVRFKKIIVDSNVYGRRKIFVPYIFL